MESGGGLDAEATGGMMTEEVAAGREDGRVDAVAAPDTAAACSSHVSPSAPGRRRRRDPGCDGAGDGVHGRRLRRQSALGVPLAGLVAANGSANKHVRVSQDTTTDGLTAAPGFMSLPSARPSPATAEGGSRDVTGLGTKYMLSKTP